MKSKREQNLLFALAGVWLCAVSGCETVPTPQGSAVFTELPLQQPKLAPDEVPASEWGPAVQALQPVKVYHEGGNVVVVQGLSGGVESGKYIVSPLSSTGPMGRFTRLTPAAANGFQPLTEVYDYERSER